MAWLDNFETKPYRIDRSTIVRLGILEFLAHFWWVVAVLPLAGIIALVFATHDAVRLIGVAAILWPLTMPARGVLASGKVAAFYSRGVVASGRDGILFFGPEAGRGHRLDPKSVRDWKVRLGHYVLRLPKLGFVAVPVAAFESPEDRGRFEALITPTER